MNTSFFGNLKNIGNPLSISRVPPDWYQGSQLKLLAPPYELLKAAHAGLSATDYEKEFSRHVLNYLDPKEVYEAICEEHGEDVTLLCFETLEKPGEFCHRRMVAKWLEETCEVKIPEWTPPQKLSRALIW